jgi:FkbM family methyltransferase
MLHKIRKQLALLRFHWHQLAVIARNYPRSTDRLVMWRTYLRINWRYTWAVRLAHRPITDERLLGFHVTLLDYLSFRDVFHELFVAREYDFPGHGAPTIVDCGSNIGMSVLFFKHLYPGCRVVCFEPSAAAFRCLRRNVEDNHLTDITLHEAAIAREPGSAILYSPTVVEGGDLEVSLMPSQQRAGALSETRVRCERLSDHLDGPVDLLKLDVQGAEGEVIEELATSGRLGLVRQIIIEHHDDRTTEGNRLGRMLQRLEDAGFDFVLDARHPPPYAAHAGKPGLVQVYAYRRGDPTTTAT